MKIRLHPVDLRLKETFRISRESRDHQPSLIVELEYEGISGFGEATASQYYGQSIESLSAAIMAVKPIVEGMDPCDPSDFWERISGALQNESFVLCALDVAMHDLWGRMQGLPLYQLWKLDPKDAPPTDYTLGLDTVERMVEKMKAHPWPIYKVKLGSEQDLEIMQELAKESEAIFRVDANGGWTAEQALAYASKLKTLRVEYIEQPLPLEKTGEMKEVFPFSDLPLIADESCQVESDVDRCHGLFHGINIKLTKCGGLTPALRMIKRAREIDLKVMVGCMTESSVGVSAAAQLLPLVDYADLDGPMLLADDPARGVRFDSEGNVIYPERPGIGVDCVSALS